MSKGQPDLHRRAFREIANPAIIADTGFIVTDVNDAILELTGYERPELVGSTPLMLVDDDAVYEEIIDALSAGKSWVGDFESTTKDGRLVYGRGSATPLVLDGETRGYVVVFTDMTRHRRYEESLRILNRVLRHNLRNDANVVLGHVERVAEAVSDPTLTESLDTAANRVEDMLGRARTTRRFGGILTGGDSDSLEPTDLASAVGDALEDVPTQQVVVSVSGTEGPVEVLADDMLVPALRAVVENAVEHNDKTVPRVDVGVSETDEHVVLSIADNGPGIDPRRHEQVLGRNERTQVDHGEGLSLFFVDRLMEMYGGVVDVRSNEPRGTVFDLHFRRPGSPPPSPGDASRWDVHGEGRAPSIEGTEPFASNGDAEADPGATFDVERGRSEPEPERTPESVAPRGLDSDGGSGPNPNAGPGTEPADPGDDGGSDRASDLAAAAAGASVTPPRLRGDHGRLPDVTAALREYEQPHHLLRLRRSGGLREGGTVLVRGDAAAALTDDAVRVVADGPEGGDWTFPYDGISAVGRSTDALVLRVDGARVELSLPRGDGEPEFVEAAAAFLRDEIAR
ncbi:sensor histidine kinase [Halorarum salinum]|uniref:histidine kinase n=1 Tax=Halorarum salinum TaxID=2743089 RepID=A0A7D5Q9T1_9EURY|nr:PAS domain-containing sensor histidine kinase [Halobaculum salinum]QLG61218.1 PAS domain-containing sensor histidine kinase [Halobaculum salinum]